MTFSARPRKRFGQHWLRSEAILDKITAAAELSDRDHVL
ncbi:MAG: 16S rRNA (adenine(1518)-N(6)/adenine(1519)-N(6))-dimethyltransferase, partial [Cyanobacteria bacterium P01_H01_bin.58]